MGRAFCENTHDILEMVLDRSSDLAAVERGALL